MALVRLGGPTLSSPETAGTREEVRPRPVDFCHQLVQLRLSHTHTERERERERRTRPMQ